MSDMKAIEEKFKATCKKAKNKENRFVSAFYSMIMFKKMYETNAFACKRSGFKLWIQDLAGSLCFTLAHDTSLSFFLSSMRPNSLWIHKAYKMLEFLSYYAKLSG